MRMRSAVSEESGREPLPMVEPQKKKNNKNLDKFFKSPNTLFGRVTSECIWKTNWLLKRPITRWEL